MKYGNYFSLKRTGIWIMINGRCFSFFKGLNTGIWQFSVWDNWWRKNKVEIDSDYCS